MIRWFASCMATRHRYRAATIVKQIAERPIKGDGRWPPELERAYDRAWHKARWWGRFA